MRSTILLVVFVALSLAGLALLQTEGTAQPKATPLKAGPPERGPAAVHLVGHEDAALLARVQDVIDDWDPRRLKNPYLSEVPTVVNGKPSHRTVIRRPDLLEFIADPEAAVALGKALYWDMQAGSDFRRRTVEGKETYYGTACASCHYRDGIDPRDRHTTRIPYVAWNKYNLDDKHPEKPGSAEPNYAEGEFKQWPYTPNEDPTGQDATKGVALVVGSQGVEPRKFIKLTELAKTGNWDSEAFSERFEKLPNYKYKPEWSMFLDPPAPEPPAKAKKSLRQITNRNSPTTANAVFADRLFHDGRAESTFNGFSIFGDHDRRLVLHKQGAKGEPIPVRVAIVQAALASQAVGPIVNEVEMSYLGRTFPDLAEKLLPRQWLEFQTIDPDDSVLTAPWLYTDATKKNRLTYADLIRKAFRPEWWNSTVTVDLALRDPDCHPGATKGPLLHANFSLFWGLSVMLYQSTLISDQSPFDAMLRGDGKPVDDRWNDDYKEILGPIVRANLAKGPIDPADPKLELKTGTGVFQHGFRTFLNRGCIECHSGLLLSEVFDRDAVADPDPKDRIAFRIERTLLPNAQADAIALRMRAFRQTTETGVLAHLATLGVPASDRPAWMTALWRMLEPAAGDYDRLVLLVEAALKTALSGALPKNPPFEKIATLLMTYEKTVSTHVGGRRFFSEDERVDKAEALTDTIPIEKMVIPEHQRMKPFPNRRPVVRPRLPIAGPLAAERYAFYDPGFYALGVSPPRFDRGVGDWSGLPNEGDDDPGVQDDARNRARSTTFLKAAGARGSAYQFRPQWKRAQPPSEKSAKPVPCDPDSDPAVTSKPRDVSWSRNVVPPGSGLADLEFRHRRSDQHFLARSRRLVFDEEPTGHRKPFLHDNELAFWGAFKTPSLRNVELTAPYMHNGRLYGLDDVINFYDAGGRLWQSESKNPDKHPAMTPLDMTPDEKKALRFFMACLTDPRVRRKQAPFDHPSLVVVNGYQNDAGAIGDERIVRVAEVGRKGLNGGMGPPPPLPSFPPK